MAPRMMQLAPLAAWEVCVKKIPSLRRAQGVFLLGYVCVSEGVYGKRQQSWRRRWGQIGQGCGIKQWCEGMVKHKAKGEKANIPLTGTAPVGLCWQQGI